MSHIKKVLFGLLFTLMSTMQVLAQTEAQAQYIYVCNQGSASVSVIDASVNEIVATVDLTQLGFSENAMPHHAVAESDGSHWYVTLIGENRVLKLNRKNEVVGETELEVPGLMAMHPADDILLCWPLYECCKSAAEFWNCGEINDGACWTKEISFLHGRTP